MTLPIPGARTSQSAAAARTLRPFWAGFALAVGAAWAALLLAARGAAEGGAAPPDLWASLCAAAGAAQPLALFAMWVLMAGAMMLPSFAPALATFRRLSAAGATTEVTSAALAGGYLAVWLAFAGAAALLQSVLSQAAVLSPRGQSLSAPLSAALLVGAGLWQLSAAKAACLARCRHPLTFFLERWRPGVPAALRMGAGLGLHCLGCCWALMLTGFVGGTMHLGWMVAATAFMLAEKLPAGRHLTRPAGAMLVVAGLAAAAGWV